ncbi:MAG TPA: ATPase, T2SS/T4P/T4SS family [Candidatus Sulfotelmatobacter sp.]|nr:ATPase, T2SS/T4P/T4SS family [Candidatus Sulfotelmatobacter sp.]
MRHLVPLARTMPLHSDTPSFALALRASLRQAPKVILVGEMRDKETIEIAMEAAETGHLVLSTLHTIDASKTVE